MKPLYALYDGDKFIDCGFSLKEMGISSAKSFFYRHGSKGLKLYKFPLDEKEDEELIKLCEKECITNVERAKSQGVSERTIYRRKNL